MFIRCDKLCDFISNPFGFFSRPIIKKISTIPSSELSDSVKNNLLQSDLVLIIMKREEYFPVINKIMSGKPVTDSEFFLLKKSLSYAYRDGYGEAQRGNNLYWAMKNFIAECETQHTPQRRKIY